MIIRFYILTVVLLSFLPMQEVKASSQDACAIWLCMPAGFPQGCSGAYGEFKYRIKKGKSPLPSLSSCTTGPNGEKTNGRYELGYEYFIPCDKGYTLREPNNDNNGIRIGACYVESCAPQYHSNREDMYCESYIAVRRVKPSFVKMWIDGKYLGQYFYQ